MLHTYKNMEAPRFVRKMESCDNRKFCKALNRWSTKQMQYPMTVHVKVAALYEKKLLQDSVMRVENVFSMILVHFSEKKDSYDTKKL